MWCRHCQQDVPAISHTGTGKTVCARCQHRLQRTAAVSGAVNTDFGMMEQERVPRREHDPIANLSDWQTDARFRHLARTLSDGPQTKRRSTRTSRIDGQRFDPPHELGDAPAAPTVNATVAGRRPAATRYIGGRRSAGSQVLSWLILLSGFVSFSCGVAIAGWSIMENVVIYRNIGLAMAFVGQGLLVTGLVLVVSRLWRSSRYANHKLHEIHWQLGEVQRTTQSIAGQRSSSAPAFYAELARGASPQMLLASLRGQLDQLAVRVDGAGR
jgi:hypothetical protein